MSNTNPIPSLYAAVQQIDGSDSKDYYSCPTIISHQTPQEIHKQNQNTTFNPNRFSIHKKRSDNIDPTPQTQFLIYYKPQLHHFNQPHPHYL